MVTKKLNNTILVTGLYGIKSTNKDGTVKKTTEQRGSITPRAVGVQNFLPDPNFWISLDFNLTLEDNK